MDVDAIDSSNEVHTIAYYWPRSSRYSQKPRRDISLKVPIILVAVATREEVSARGPITSPRLPRPPEVLKVPTALDTQARDPGTTVESSRFFPLGLPEGTKPAYL